jgi:UDP-3-O-[3-hydroxymyristoyl] glucosamine N-acyltransferase
MIPRLFDLDSIKAFLLEPRDINLSFEKVGFVDSTFPGTLSFAERENFLIQGQLNPNVTGILVRPSLLSGQQSKEKIIVCSEPQYALFQLHTILGKRLSTRAKNRIDPSAFISPSALIAPVGVEIGPNVVVEDFCVIHENTTIGKNSIIASGSVIGSSGLYIARDSAGNSLIPEHLGSTIIGENVNIRSGVIVEKGMFIEDKTLVADRNAIGAKSIISHGVNLGSDNFIAAGVNICGYTSIEKNNWLGPSSVVSHKLKVGSNNYIALGATLLRSINDGTKVIGNRIFTNRDLF